MNLSYTYTKFTNGKIYRGGQFFKAKKKNIIIGRKPLETNAKITKNEIKSILRPT